MKRLLLSAIRFYRRAVSPLFPPRCRYIPTCSEYALEAVEKYGAGQGELAGRQAHPAVQTPSTRAGMIPSRKQRFFPSI